MATDLYNKRGRFTEPALKFWKKKSVQDAFSAQIKKKLYGAPTPFTIYTSNTTIHP